MKGIQMKKTLPIILAIIIIIEVVYIFILTRHTHEFSNATCTTASTCECGEEQGEPLEHSFKEATCTEPMTCELCGLTEGEALGHSWLDATYEAPKTCGLCGLTEGEPLTNMDTKTNADRGNATGEAAVKPNVETNTSDIDTSSIDWNSINPKVHAPFNKDLGIPAVDNIMCEYMLNNCPAFTQSTTEDTKAKLAEYLMDYYDNNFGDNEWIQFAVTGDESVLNLTDQVSDEVLDMSEEELKEFFEEIGIDPDKLNDTTSGSNGGSGGNNNSGGINGGGGSAPVVTPDTNQNTSEENFVTPEVPSGNNGSGNSDPWQGDGTFSGFDDLGDGGEIITDIQLNP